MAAEIANRRAQKRLDEKERKGTHKYRAILAHHPPKAKTEHAVWPSFGAQSRAVAPATCYAVDFDKNGQPIRIVPIPGRAGGPINICGALSPTGSHCRHLLGHSERHQSDNGSTWPVAERCSEIVRGGDQCVRPWQHDGAHRYSGGPFRSTADADSGQLDSVLAGIGERKAREAARADELRGERTPREPITGKWSDATGAPLADVLAAKFVDSSALKAPAPVPGILALVAVLDTTIERLEHRLTNVLRAEDPTASPRVSDSDLARRIEGCIIDLNEIIERVDV
jgi:hypothetical protein